MMMFAAGILIGFSTGAVMIVAVACAISSGDAERKVVPVKHGHWRQVDENKCECSNCGIIVLIAVYPHGDKNYCPNCGAKMDKGSEENNNG